MKSWNGVERFRKTWKPNEAVIPLNLLRGDVTFDIDANDLDEAQDVDHRPFREGFSSINKGAMHACGHDGHAAVGLALAELIANCSNTLKGRIKLIFQPAEEGTRGARVMVEKGVVDDVTIFLGTYRFQSGNWDGLSCGKWIFGNNKV